MASQFFGLNIAYTGLVASNSSLNTTANNISNAETKGYSRQSVNQTASEALRTNNAYGCAGSGVSANYVERTRDAFYDFKYWGNATKLGEVSSLGYYMRQIEDYFADNESVEGFTTIFNKMYESLEEVSKNAGDASTKSQFIGYAQRLSYYFNSLSEGLKELQTDTNTEIKNRVDQINSYAAELASLNTQINVIELTGVKANDLRDKRDLIIDGLSKIVDVQVDETRIYDTNQPERETGANRYQVKIADGQLLVDTDSYSKLVCEARASYETVNQSDALGLYDISWSDGRTFNIYSSRIGGELRGLLEIREGNNGENFQGTVTGVTAMAGGGSEVSIQSSLEYLKDLNKCTLSDDGGIIKLGSETYYYDSFRVNLDASGNITDYTFVIGNDPNKNSKQPSVGRIGKEASVGEVVTYQGIPYYQQQMNEWTRTFATAFNEILTQTGSVDGYNNTPDILFVADSATDPSQLKFLDSRSGSLVLSSTSDSYYRLTASNFAVSKEIALDAQLLATRTNASDGVDKYDVVTDLLDLRANKSKMQFRGSSANEFLQCILSDISLNTNNANTMKENYSNMESAIENQRQSISGVDKDEEAINLVKFQHSYTLASKMIQVLTEVYDRLILQTGV